MQPRVSAPWRVAEQNLELIASWPANECGQTSHASCTRSVRASGDDVVDVGGTARGMVAQT